MRPCGPHMKKARELCFTTPYSPWTGPVFRSELSIHFGTRLPEFYSFFLHDALKLLWPSREASRASFSATLSRCRRSLLGLPRGASIRCRLLLGLLISAASPSKPMVAFTRSRRTALPTVVSPARYALIASVNSASRNRALRLRQNRLLEIPWPYRSPLQRHRPN
jgi:hypothetical protein